MSNQAFKTLVRRYPSSLTDNWVTNLHHYTPAFIVYQGDALHQNTIDDSNVVCIHAELVGEFPHEVHKKIRPYVEEIFIYAEDLESDAILAERVLEIMESLENYAIYDESHYCELEHERLVKYMDDNLVDELAHELNRGDDAEEIKKWVKDNLNTAWEYIDGSVDDAPFNVEELAKLIP